MGENRGRGSDDDAVVRRSARRRRQDRGAAVVRTRDNAPSRDREASDNSVSAPRSGRTLGGALRTIAMQPASETKSSGMRWVIRGILFLALVVGARVLNFESDDAADALGGIGKQTPAVETPSRGAPVGRTPTREVRAPETVRPFDYYVLALSWSPSFCRGKPGAEQCGQGARFVWHGLWPQFEEGWPSDCETDYPSPRDSLLRRYTGLGVSEGLLAYQWRKHGACSGLSPQVYFELATRATDSIAIPVEFQRLAEDRAVDPRSLEQVFLRANPGFARENITIKCSDGRFSEVRICLTPDLEPRRCGADVIRDCGARSIELPAPSL